MFWDAARAKLLTVWRKHAGEVTALAFNPNDLTLVTASSDESVKLWDVREGPDRSFFQADQKKGRILALGFRDGGKTLAALGREEKKFTQWDVASRTQIDSPSFMHSISGFSISPNGHELAVIEQVKVNVRRVTLCHLAAGGKPDSIPDTTNVRCVAFCPENGTLALGRDDGSLTLRDPAGVIWRREGGKQPLGAVCFAGRGALVAAAGREFKQGAGIGVVYLWEVAGDKAPAQLPGHTKPVTSLACSPDSMTLASADEDGNVFLWDVAGPRLLHRLEHADGIQSLAFTPDGKILAAAGKNVRLWDVATGKLRVTLEVAGENVYSVAFASNGKILAAGCKDGIVKLWEGAEEAPPP
jgi:WD40 repeat protein